MLELCCEGLERVGYTENKLSGGTTGAFLGISINGATNGIPPDLKRYSITESVSATMAGHLSYTFGLQELSLIVDTACSSTLVDMHLDCNALHQGECNMALTGGASLLLNLDIHVVSASSSFFR